VDLLLRSVDQTHSFVLFGLLKEIGPPTLRRACVASQLPASLASRRGGWAPPLVRLPGRLACAPVQSWIVPAVGPVVRATSLTLACLGASVGCSWCNGLACVAGGAS